MTINFFRYAKKIRLQFFIWSCKRFLFSYRTFFVLRPSLFLYFIFYVFACALIFIENNILQYFTWKISFGCLKKSSYSALVFVASLLGNVYCLKPLLSSQNILFRYFKGFLIYFCNTSIFAHLFNGNGLVVFENLTLSSIFFSFIGELDVPSNSDHPLPYLCY